MSTDLKIHNLVKQTANYKLKDFMLLEDMEGWSDGFIADFGFNAKRMELKARLLDLDRKLTRFVVGENKPKIKSVIPKKQGEEITDVELDLEDGKAILHSKKLRNKVEPTFVKYFFNTYKGCKFFLTGEMTPIKVMYMGTLTGIIMPIKEHS